MEDATDESLVSRANHYPRRKRGTKFPRLRIEL